MKKQDNYQLQAQQAKKLIDRGLWDKNTEQYLRYETTRYAVGLRMQRLRKNMPK